MFFRLKVMPRYSQMQRQVLLLYRQFLKAANGKPGVTSHVRQQFRVNATIPKTEVVRIENLVRRAERQLAMLQKPTVDSISSLQSIKD